jgi:hypothetical protein
MKNNFGILISNYPQRWGLDMEEGGKGRGKRTKDREEGQKSTVLSLYPVYCRCWFSHHS